VTNTYGKLKTSLLELVSSPTMITDQLSKSMGSKHFKKFLIQEAAASVPGGLFQSSFWS
jgi:hypothetical protein